MSNYYRAMNEDFGNNTECDFSEAKHTKMKHTKTPWVITNVNPNTIKIANGFNPVCTITHPHWDEEAEANARLIASAPDLLEALTNLVERDFIKDKEGDHYQEALEAIAKARGEK